MPGFTGPTHLKMAPYVLKALQELGGKAPYADIDQRVIDIMGLSNEVASFLMVIRAEPKLPTAWHGLEPT